MSSREISSLKLITLIFNTFSSRQFLPKHCAIHSEWPLSCVCASCVQFSGEMFCEQCFNSHECDDPQNKSLSSWMSEQKDRIMRSVQSASREAQMATGLRLNGFKFNACGQADKTLSELNNFIVMEVNRHLESGKHQIQNKCISPIIADAIPTKFTLFSDEIEQQLSLLTSDLRTVISLCKNAEKMSGDFNDEIKVASEGMKQSCLQFHRQSIQKVFQDILDGLSTETKMQEDGKNENTLRLYEKRISSLEQQLKKTRQQLVQQSSKAVKLSQQLRNLSETLEQKQVQLSEMKFSYERTIKDLEGQVKKIQQKSQGYKPLEEQIKEKNRECARLRAQCNNLSSLLEEEVIKGRRNEMQLKQTVSSLERENQQLGTKVQEITENYEQVTQQLEFVANQSISMQEELDDRRSADTSLQQSSISIENDLLKMKVEDLQQQLESVTKDLAQFKTKNSKDKINNVPSINSKTGVTEPLKPEIKIKQQSKANFQKPQLSKVSSQTSIPSPAKDNEQEGSKPILKKSTKDLGAIRKNQLPQAKVVSSPRAATKNSMFQESPKITEEGSKLVKKNRNHLNKKE